MAIPPSPTAAAQRLMTGPNVACGKNIGDADPGAGPVDGRSLSRQRRFHGCSRLNKSFFIALDLARQPPRARVGPDHGKNRRRLDDAPFAGLGIFQLGFFEDFSARHFSNLGLKENLDILLFFHSARKVGRHPGKIVASDDEQHFGGAFGKEHRRLAR
jgi:hypothetical protein